MNARQDRMPLALLLVLLALGYGFLLAANALALGSSGPTSALLWKLQLPRLALSVLVGIGLAVSGGLVQGVLRNDLVEPGILGVHAGGNLAATLLTLALPALTLAHPTTLALGAWFGALAAALAIFALTAGPGGRKPTQVILVGVALGAALSAAALAVAALSPIQVYRALIFRQAGSLSGADASKVGVMLPFVLILGPLSFGQARTADVLSLGDETAAGLGLAVVRSRAFALGIAAGLSGACVAVGGGLAFVGLLAPHIARRFVGPAQRRMLLVAALFGGLLVLAADLLGRIVFPPAELPAGLFAGLIGAPYLLYLLMTA